MRDILKIIPVFLLFMLISKYGNAQTYNSYQAFDAALLRVNDNGQTESRLKKVIIALSRNSQRLSVRSADPGLLFNLTMNIDTWEVQQYLTSTKVFTTQGSLTLNNNTTRTVMVEYMPLPAGTDLDGDFNLNMIIQFNTGDFGLDAARINSKFIIKINNAKVTRI